MGFLDRETQMNMLKRRLMMTYWLGGIVIPIYATLGTVWVWLERYFQRMSSIEYGFSLLFILLSLMLAPTYWNRSRLLMRDDFRYASFKYRLLGFALGIGLAILMTLSAFMPDEVWAMEQRALCWSITKTITGATSGVTMFTVITLFFLPHSIDAALCETDADDGK